MSNHSLCHDFNCILNKYSGFRDIDQLKPLSATVVLY